MGLSECLIVLSKCTGSFMHFLFIGNDLIMVSLWPPDFPCEKDRYNLVSSREEVERCPDHTDCT